MKYEILFLLVVNMAIGMQPALIIKDQLHNAIDQGNLRTVQRILAQDRHLAKDTKKLTDYGEYVLFKIEQHINDQKLAPKYVAIAEYLKNKGATINTQKLHLFKQRIMSESPLTLVKSTSSPLIVLEPASSITTISDAPESPRGNKPPATFKELHILIQQLDVKKLEEYIAQHDLKYLTPADQEHLLAPVIASFNYFKKDPERKKYAQIIQVLIKNEFNPGKATYLYKKVQPEIEKLI